jgi:hypothetical protein
MKPAAFVTVLLLLSATALAQFSLLPQIGFDRSKTAVLFNNDASFTPAGATTFFKGSIRLDYKFKKGHGPFIGVGTSPAPVKLSFDNPNSANTSYTASVGSSLWRLEAGYMYTSKAITLKKASKSTSKSNASTQKAQAAQTEHRSPCGAYYHPSCGSYNRCGSKARQAPVKKPSDLTLKFQPSVAFAYVPSVPENVEQKGNGYQYNAGNYKTGIIGGLGFELGKGRQRLMTLSVYYTSGIGNLGEESITKIENGKQVVSTFSSSTSSWAMTIGVPITFSKAKKQTVKKEQKVSCQQQHNSCHSRCYKRF